MWAVHWGVLFFGLFGLFTSSVFLVMVLTGAWRFRREAVREDARLGQRPEFLPAISLFKPLHGDEFGLEANLRTFFEQDYLQHVALAGKAAEENGVSRVELLFCARSEADEGLEIARRVAAEYPEITTRFVTSGAPWAANGAGAASSSSADASCSTRSCAMSPAFRVVTMSGKPASAGMSSRSNGGLGGSTYVLM